LERRELIALAEAAASLRASKRSRPLAYAFCWDAALPKTSQRRAIASLGDRVTIIVGGNRAGKTYAGAMLAVVFALGSEHPDVIEWARINRWPHLDRVPAKGGKVCCVSLTSNESMRVQRPAVEMLLPAGSAKWRNRHGPGEAIATIAGRGSLIFKTADQGSRAFQADSWDFLWADEELTEPVWNEARMRLIDRRGHALLTMTPLRGKTWVYDRYFSSQETGSNASAIWGEHNPHIPTDELAALLRTYGPHERAARARGEFTALEGRVYEFWREMHVVPSFSPPEDWPRYGTIDFGTRNPFCFLILAVDPSDDVVHVIAEHYQSDWTLSRHARRIKEMTNHGSPSLGWIVADPEDRGSRLSLAREHGIPTIKARKEIRAGINAVAERLLPDVVGRPHLLIHDCCTNLVAEFEEYIWTPAGKGQPEKPRKSRDHALDALRYGVMQLARTEPFAVG